MTPKAAERAPQGRRLVETGGVGGGISGDSEPSVVFYIEVDDPQKYLDKAVSLAGTVVLGVTEIPGMVIMPQFADRKGNIIGLVKTGYPE